jgi:hypothetical protein
VYQPQLELMDYFGRKLHQTIESEKDLYLHRLFTPQRTVVVEGGYAPGRWHKVRAPLPS